MSNFFTLGDGTNAANGEGSFSADTAMEPLPENTDVMAVCDQAKWDTYNDTDYISLRWTILKPAEFENRKIFHRLQVLDPKKSDKHKRMLAAIDVNAGGRLAKCVAKPTDDDLESALVNRIMMLKLGLYEFEDEKDTTKMKRGNWVKAVSPKGAAATSAPVAATKAKPPVEDDDIAF